MRLFRSSAFGPNNMKYFCKDNRQLVTKTVRPEHDPRRSHQLSQGTISRNFFRGCGRGFSPINFVSFLPSFFLFLSSLFFSLTLPWNGTLNPWFRGALLNLLSARDSDICSYRTRSLGSKYTIFGVFRAQGTTCPVAANVVLFLLNEI